ncbi:MAG: hypothetical protein AAFN93_03055 [Bacteroidota bacterium]
MRYTLISIFLLLTFSVKSQTLQEQYNTLKENSENYKVYKVIKRTELEQFWSIVQDSIQTSEGELIEANQQITAHQTSIAQLNSNIEKQQAEIGGLQFDTNHIQVLGIDFSKDSYIIINFTVIVGLVIALGLLYYRFKHDHKVAKSKVAAYQKLDAEFEDYKKNSLEKQMKLRRELQTERNRIDEIRSA